MKKSPTYLLDQIDGLNRFSWYSWKSLGKEGNDPIWIDSTTFQVYKESRNYNDDLLAKYESHFLQKRQNRQYRFQKKKPDDHKKAFQTANIFPYTANEIHYTNNSDKILYPYNLALHYPLVDYFRIRHKKIENFEVLYISEQIKKMNDFFQDQQLPIAKIPLKSLYTDPYLGSIKVNLFELEFNTQADAHINYQEVFKEFISSLLQFKYEVDNDPHEPKQISLHHKYQLDVCIFSHTPKNQDEETNSDKVKFDIDNIDKIINFIDMPYFQTEKYNDFKETIKKYIENEEEDYCKVRPPFTSNSYFTLLKRFIHEKNEKMSETFFYVGIDLLLEVNYFNQQEKIKLYEKTLSLFKYDGIIDRNVEYSENIVQSLIKNRMHFVLNSIVDSLIEECVNKYGVSPFYDEEDRFSCRYNDKFNLFDQGDYNIYYKNEKTNLSFFAEKGFHRKHNQYDYIYDNLLFQTDSKFRISILNGNGTDYISYFPGKYLYNYIEENKFNITTQDKIVFLLEICYALRDLFQNSQLIQSIKESKQYIGISDDYFLVNEHKDVYLYRIDFHDSQVTVKTHPGNIFYYLHYNMIKNQDNSLITSKYSIKIDEPNENHSLYSFAVLMYYILTLQHPYTFLENTSRDDKCNIIQNHKYWPSDPLEWLKQDDGYLKISKIDGELVDLQNILKVIIIHTGPYNLSQFSAKYPNSPELKMKLNTFQDVINEIEKTRIYKTYEPEIKYRINHAYSGKEYKCTLASLAVAQFNFHPNSKINHVKNRFTEKRREVSDNTSTIDLFAKCDNIVDFYRNLSLNQHFIYQDHLSKLNLFINIDIHNSDYNFWIFSDKSEKIYFSRIDPNDIICTMNYKSRSTRRINSSRNNSRYLLSIKQQQCILSKSFQIMNIPMMKLRTFLQCEDNIDIKYKLLWMHQIFQSIIGLYEMKYCPDISEDTILLCYNSHSDYFDATLFPFRYNHSLDSSKDFSDDLFEEKQRKVIREYCQMIRVLFEKDEEKIYVTNLLKICDKETNLFEISETINVIISKSSVKEEVDCIMMHSPCSFKKSYRFIAQAVERLSKISKIKHKSNNLKDPFYSSFLQMAEHNFNILENQIGPSQTDSQEKFDIQQIFSNLNIILEKVYQKEIIIYTDKSKPFDQETIITESQKYDQAQYINYSQLMTNKNDQMMCYLSDTIPRCLEISGLQKKSVFAFLKRYFNQLNPSNSYKIICIIINKNEFVDFQKDPITTDDLKQFSRETLKIPFIDNETNLEEKSYSRLENGRIVFNLKSGYF
ncbi:hypothetical protein TRFO_28495 [Tritrichomonas foetus]|uniref:Protein kinase domain-containing protein n=1 Tax=Tritrichomonas foetus TaxID=1144522 RepID=A0A1J4JYJ5_9EUKA|nr:hypothetical protein TRFO_28495 [Tritrichomonas foetus]|eukprot:OHT04059.1 hypothetical protein TRFO_28495 [Tritrichomonas foetus]